MIKLYLDTNVILAYILVERDFDTKKFEYKLKKCHHPVIVPQVVIGETLVKIMERSTDSTRMLNIQKFVNFLENVIDVNNNSPPINSKVLETATDIMRVDDSIGYADALLVAHAATDGDPCWLCTSDGRIHDSQPIFEIVKEVSNDSVNMVYDIF